MNKGIFGTIIFAYKYLNSLKFPEINEKILEQFSSIIKETEGNA